MKRAAVTRAGKGALPKRRERDGRPWRVRKWFLDREFDQDRLHKYISPEPNSGCWLWVGSLKGDGYANVSRFRRNVLVHRMLYELTVGPIPDGLTLDHLCRVKSCVNPSHLEAVPRHVNVWRSYGYREDRPAGICPRGHTMERYRGRNVCRQCRIAQARDWKRRHGYTRAKSRPKS